MNKEAQCPYYIISSLNKKSYQRDPMMVKLSSFLEFPVQ